MAQKSPTESYTFTYDFSNNLGSTNIVSVQAVQSNGPDAALINEAQSNTTKVVLVRWGAGTDGASYSTMVRVVSTTGDTFEAEGVIAVGFVADAPSYGTDDGFRVYHTSRGRDVSTYDNDQIAGARLVASEWIDDSFRSQFQGLKVAPTTQEREWPRTGVVDYYGYMVTSTVVPAQIDRATYEAAYRELQTAGALSTDARAKPYTQVRIEGAIAVSYGNQDAESLKLQMPIIGQILSYLLYGQHGGPLSSLSGPLVRA
jgi:hypothetical protein